MSRWPLEWLRRQGRTHVVAGLDARGLVLQFNGAAASAVAMATEDVSLAQQIAPHTRVDVIVADDVAVHWLQTPPAGVQSLTELRRIAAARCACLFGGTPERWWVAGDWSASSPFVCAGLPQERVGPLESALTATGAITRWHTAFGLLCSTRARSMPAEGWSALRSASQVLAWHCRLGRVTALHAVNLGPQASIAQADDAVAQLLRIEALRDPALALGPVHWAQRPGPTPTSPDTEASMALAMAPWLPAVVR